MKSDIVSSVKRFSHIFQTAETNATVKISKRGSSTGHRCSQGKMNADRGLSQSGTTIPRKLIGTKYLRQTSQHSTLSRDFESFEFLCPASVAPRQITAPTEGTRQLSLPWSQSRSTPPKTAPINHEEPHRSHSGDSCRYSNGDWHLCSSLGPNRIQLCIWL